ncbi:MAG: methylmalonyl-CoA epimerase [Deltaproteobacteria bacterium]|nr:methylmalonyl-CoA epimerase [Deltaproteobacteria bacterium]
MNVKKISHLGIAVPDIEKYVSSFKDVFGLELTGIEEVLDQKVKVAFLTVGESRLELLEPTDPSGAVGKFLEKRDGKPGFHHMALEVEDVEASLKEAEEKGLELIDKKPRIGAGGAKIGFIHPKSTAGVLTELCEHKKD